MKNLTEKQSKFIEHWADQDNKDTFMKMRASMDAAGYSRRVTFGEVTKPHVKAAMLEAISNYLLVNGMEAAAMIKKVMNGEETLGAATKLKAAETVLDRVGIAKQTCIEVKTDPESAIVVIPAKRED